METQSILRSFFVLFLEVSRTAVYVVMVSLMVLNLLTLLFQKNFVCIIFVGGEMMV